jgi:hypothetical protein
MARSGSRSRLIAWVALLATLFSAVSPAFAAALLSDQPAALAQMLGIPPAPQIPAEGDHSAHAMHHHYGADSKANDGAPHKNHGIYCSLCLNASSTVAVAGLPAPIVIATLASNVSAAESQHGFITAFRPLFRSRAPPR